MLLLFALMLPFACTNAQPGTARVTVYAEVGPSEVIPSGIAYNPATWRELPTCTNHNEQLLISLKK
jgi:hypothetical protein